MAASVGWIVNEAGITFDGDIATGVPFASLGKGVSAWAAARAGVHGPSSAGVGREPVVL